MTHYRFTSSKPCHWVSPRSYTDASLRKHHYGPIQSMSKPGFFARLLGAK